MSTTDTEKIATHAPASIGGHDVIRATASPCRGLGVPWNGDGSPVYYCGAAVIVREDGRAAFISYDEAHGQVYGTSGAGETYYSQMSTAGVDYVARWVSRGHALRQWREDREDAHYRCEV